MSNYVQSTNFATKDALPSGDPLKIVKGTEINTEFNNIATAVATKADTASPTLTSPTLVTPALGTPTSGVMTNVTGLPIDGGTTGTLPVARGGTGVTTSTGTGNNVLSNSPTLVSPALGTPSALVGTNITGTAAGLSIGGNAATATNATNATNANTVTTVTTAQVLGATAGAAHEDIGSMTIAWNTTTSNVASNGTIAGSSLRFTSASVNSTTAPADIFKVISSGFTTFPTSNTTALTGTWKNMGGFCRGRFAVDVGAGIFEYYWFPSLWLRTA
jgi:hypothetical protein